MIAASTNTAREGINEKEKMATTAQEKINKIIKTKLNQTIAFYTNQANCNHIWDDYGRGYKCCECGYYTGLDMPINKRIDKLPAFKRPR